MATRILPQAEAMTGVGAPLASGGHTRLTGERVPSADLATERAPGCRQGTAARSALVHRAFVCDPMAGETLQFWRSPWWGNITLSRSAPAGDLILDPRALQQGHASPGKESWAIRKRHQTCSRALMGTEHSSRHRWEQPGPPSPTAHSPPTVRASTQECIWGQTPG